MKRAYTFHLIYDAWSAGVFCSVDSAIAQAKALDRARGINVSRWRRFGRVRPGQTIAETMKDSDTFITAEVCRDVGAAGDIQAMLAEFYADFPRRRDDDRRRRA